MGFSGSAATPELVRHSVATVTTPVATTSRPNAASSRDIRATSVSERAAIKRAVACMTLDYNFPERMSTAEMSHLCVIFLSLGKMVE